METQLNEIRGHLIALHTVAALLLAREAQRSGLPMDKLHQFLANEVQSRLGPEFGTKTETAAHAIHKLDMLASTAGAMLDMLPRPK
jgi:hypothetical protein